MKTIYLDIMRGGRFFRQLAYDYCPLFPIDIKELQDFVEKRFPSLAGTDYNINFSNQKTF
jgi:hypothetical protein